MLPAIPLRFAGHRTTETLGLVKPGFHIIAGIAGIARIAEKFVQRSWRSQRSQRLCDFHMIAVIAEKKKERREGLLLSFKYRRQYECS